MKPDCEEPEDGGHAPLSALVEDLEAKALQLQSEISEREAEVARKPLDVLRAEQVKVSQRLKETRCIAAQARQQRHHEARAHYEANLAQAEAERQNFLRLWRECSVALGRLADLDADLSRDAIILRAYESEDLALTTRANAALAPPNPRAEEAGADLQIGTINAGWNWHVDVQPTWIRKEHL